MQKEEVLGNWTYYYRCLKILEFNGSFTKRDICSKTKDTNNNKNLLELIKFLNVEGFLDIDDTRIPHLYFLQKDKLARFLRESLFFKNFGLVVEITKPSTYSY